jgi:hypothetical protein
MIWLLIGVGVVAVVIVVGLVQRQQMQAARGWRARASELYSRSVALHDRLAVSAASTKALSPPAVERLADAEWMADDVGVGVAGLVVGAPNETARVAASDLATSLGSVKEAIHLRVQMPEAAENGDLVAARLDDLDEALGGFRAMLRTGRGRREPRKE